MKNRINYKKDYSRAYFEEFAGTQKAEKRANFEAFFDLIKETKPGFERVLDVGCGLGGFLEVCEEAGIKKTWGIDVSHYAIKKAKKKVKAKILKLNVDEARLPFPNNFFDLVVAIDVVEHIKRSDLLFAEIYRILKKKGVFFMTTENSGSFFDKLFSPFYPRHKVHINLNNEEFWKKSLFNISFRNIESRGIILHGFPPPLSLRNFLRKVKIPVLVKPIFSPIKTFSATLVITAIK